MQFEGIRSGYTVAVKALARGAMPPPKLSVWEFADQFIWLPSTVTNRRVSGRYQTSRTPMGREIMECLSPHHPAKRVVAMMSSQLMKTQIGINFLLFYTQHDPQTQLVVWPSEDVAERNSKTKYTPIVDASPAIASRFVSAKSRDSGNTILDKTFQGGSAQFAGANSPAGLSSRGGAILWCDEVDRFPNSAGVEGDPVSIARRALISYQDCAKEYISSTPTIKSLSRIFKEFQLSDQRYYHVPCVECGELQKLEWNNFKWDVGRPETAHFVCVHNGCIIRERDKPKLFIDEQLGGRAKWIAERPESKVPGFHGWAAYSSLNMGMSWATLAEEWENCKGDPEKEKVYINIYRGECFDDPTEKLDWEVIKNRATPYKLRTIPAGCLVLTAAVDVQGNRLEMQMLGWGTNGRVWVIDYVAIPGDPTQSAVWEKLDEIIDTPIINRFGVAMKVRSYGVDSNYLTDDVLKYVRTREYKGAFALHGSKMQGRQAISTATPQDRTARGKQKRGGVKSWLIGGDGLKHTLFLWLQDDGKDGMDETNRRIHFSNELPDEYFTGLCAEIYDPHKKRWVKQQRANEPLDTFIYAIAAARHPKLRLHLFRDSDWARFEAVIEPANGDLFTQPIADNEAPHEASPIALKATAAKTQKLSLPKRGGFVNGWKK